MSVPRVAVVTEIPTPYREPVFDIATQDPEFEFSFFYLDKSQADRYWNINPSQPGRSKFLKGFQFCIRGHHTVYLNRGVSGSLLAPPFDAYVLGGYAQPVMLKLLRFCWRTGRPYVMITESHFGKRRSTLLSGLKEGYLKKVYGKAGGNLVMSSAAGQYVQSYGAKEDSLFLFSNCMDSEVYAAKIRDCRNQATMIRERLNLGSNKVVLFVGALIRRKGVDTLLSAFCQVAKKHPAVSLVFVGRGRMRSQLESMAEKAGLESRVRFVDFVQPDELPSFYAIADIFVLPSVDEPFGAVICEAMAGGLPVITSRTVGAASDFVRHEENGFLTDAGNVEQLVDGISKLLSDPEKRNRMGQRSREIIQPWTSRKIAENLIGSVRRCLEDTSRAQIL